ncbi:hypothetical protein CBS101457_005533 [Exobasidium rhododendri]|nr:hypothetical protein CBS101457_005533 [Exobasidium rhododendri]
MDYFKSAATAFLAKASPLPNYTIGDRDTWFEGKTIWSLHQGVRKEDSSDCSILVFDATLPAHNPRHSSLLLAKNALRKLRTTRHPDVVKLLDSAETPTAVYIAIESVKPLGRALEDMRAKAGQKEEWIGWGLSKIASAIKFLNSDAKATHGNIRMESIFMASSGEWRLGGFELLSSLQDEAPTLYKLGGLVPDSGMYAPPEVKQQGWGTLRDLEPHTLDSYMFALFILKAYNGSLPPTITSVPSQGKVPTPIYQLVRRMMTLNAKSRLPTAQLLLAGQADGGFFSENRLVKIASGLDGFVLAREEERMEIMRQLKSSSDSFPPEFLQYKVLPAIINALALASSNQSSNTLSTTLQANRILPLVLQLGSTLSDKEWNLSVGPSILKAFTSPDRAVRMILLESLDMYANRMENRTVSDKIWPNLITGFGDSAAIIREATVKAVLPLSSKLSERILNNDLLRQLARTQVDVEAGIRTNTTILLGSLAPKLSLQTRKKVLVPAFSRSLKDPFVHARNAGVMALMATSESFDGDDSAKLIIPALSPCLVDVERIVRDQAKGALAIFLAKAEELASKMPDLAISDDSAQPFGDQNGAQSIIASTASGAASALTSWTFSQFAKPGDTSRLLLNSDMSNSDRNGSEARSNDTFSAINSIPSAPTAISPSSSKDSFAASDVRPSNWSKQGDLMDVMDDDDDWTGFETAPVRNILSTKKKSLGSRTMKSPTSRGSALGGSQSVASGKKLLAVIDVADQGAWDDDDLIRELSITPAKAASVQKVKDISRSDSPATAFAKAPAWEGNISEAGEAVAANYGEVEQADAGNWNATDAALDEDILTTKVLVVASAGALTKEEKRAEMEKKREERKRRMAQLKESKASKLALGLT